MCLTREYDHITQELEDRYSDFHSIDSKITEPYAQELVPVIILLPISILVS